MSSNQASGLPTVRAGSQKGAGKSGNVGPGGRELDLPALNLPGDDGAGGGAATNVPTEMPPTPRRRDVDTMPSFEIMEHLRKRNCVPTGFYEDDKHKLQVLFDEDYEKQKATRQAYMAHVNANRKANYTREFAERKQQRDVMEISTALKNNPRVPAWLELVKVGQSAPYASWNGIKRPLVRHIAAQLPVQSNLLGLEFCRCGINDEICSFIATMLLSNRSLRQLNLAENLIGAAGLTALAKALEVNDVLRFIGLQGNKLRNVPDTEQPSDAGVKVVAEMLKVNNTLVRLDLLNTGLGASSFALLGEALRRNQSVVILDADATLASLADARAIKLSLAANQHRQKLELAKKKKARLVVKKVEILEEEEVEQKHEEKRVLEWIETARRDRIQDRKRLLQEQRDRQLAEEEQQREAARLAMEAALAAASKKKKKKGGKAKKKK